MIRSDKAEILATFLGSLPEAVALRLARAVELDRLADGKALPHDLILEGLRPVLRKADAVERTPTPMRLFCQPFEDLLTETERKEKLAGRIALSSVTTVWTWLSETLLQPETVRYSAAVKADVLGYRSDNAVVTAQHFWPVASAAILTALSTEEGADEARTALGNNVVVADAREMALLLSIGPQVMELHKKLPASTPAMSDELLWALRAIYESVVSVAPDSAPYVAVVAMNRLARPWEALRLPLAISRQTQDTLIASTDMGLVGEILFAEIEEHAVAVRAVRQPVFDADDLVTHISAFASLSNGLVKEVEMRRTGKWGQRLMKERAALAEVMDGFMKRAPKEILGALPTLKTGAYAGGPRMPDVARAPDQEKRERALRYAHLLAGCRDFAAAGSFGAALANALDEISTALHGYCEDMLRELRAAEGERRIHAEQFFTLATDLTELLVNPEQSEFLRRRGKAALNAQAAA